MDKKTWIIISLSLVIIILIFLNYTGDSEFETIIESLQGQRDNAIRSAEIIEYELDRSIEESAELRKNYIEARGNNTKLKSENREYRIIIGKLTAGSKITDKGLEEYGEINREFGDFIREFGTEE